MTTEEQKTHLDGMEAAVSNLYMDQTEGRYDHEAKAKAEMLWLTMLPTLTSRAETQLFIAAVARGFALKWLHRDTVRQCLYLAQLALASFGTVSVPKRKGGVQ